MLADAFTADELREIDDFYRRKLENLTADEMQLYTRWIVAKAQEDAAFVAEEKRRDEYLQSKLDCLQRESEATLNNLRETRDIARARLERVKHGQEKQE